MRFLKYKIAILGDMLELGGESENEHKRIGEKSALASDVLITVGSRAKGIAEGALKQGLSKENIFQFDNSKIAKEFIKAMVETGDAILIKGSQGIRMERIVEFIMSEPERKKELLVRQDAEWAKR